jgi:hypothetical protein
MFREKIANYYAVRKKHLNPLRTESVEDGAYGNHRTLKGYSL